MSCECGHSKKQHIYEEGACRSGEICPFQCKKYKEVYVHRNVGGESRKTYLEKLSNGFFLKYMWGNGLDVGFAGYEPNVVSILSGAIGVDVNYPGYDGKTLPFPDNSQQFVYSSHCLEHISDYRSTIQEWFRIVKPGGYIITVVPHKYLYEKKENLPSQFNGDHKRFYTPASLLQEFEDSLQINTYRVRHLQDNDKNHDYAQPLNEHSKGEYELELVIQKL